VGSFGAVQRAISGVTLPLNVADEPVLWRMSVEMHYELSGDGSPSVVLVHGFASDNTDWTAQVEALNGRHRVVTCDLRGHGRTPGKPQDCSIETYGADIAKLVEALQLAPAVLVGHSMGCRIVLEAAHRRPDAVAGLVLIDGSLTGSGDPEAAEQATREKIAAKGYRAFFEGFFRDTCPVPFDRADKIIERAGRLPAEIGSVLFPRISRWDAQHMDTALAAVQVPLMVIQSTYMDPTLKRASLPAGQSSPWLDRVRQYAPNARIEIVSGAGHFVHMEKAEQVNALLQDFLAEMADPLSR
jgi:pimeloyl-ACP methyl ester carboxylesterase